MSNSAENPSASLEPNETDLDALRQAFEAFTRTTSAMEESYKLLEERVRTLDDELQEKNRELAFTTEYLNSVLDSMTDGVVVVELDGIITTCNRAAAEMLGCRPEDAVGESHTNLFGRDFREVPAPRAAELTSKDGNTVPVSECSAPLADRTGAHHGFVKVFQDLREIESLRSQMRQKERLAALGEMAATVAHEIRNPLGGIRGFAALLDRDLPEDDDRKRLVSRILEGVQNLERVVGELLDYTRPLEPSPSNVHVKELVQKTLEYVQAPSEGIQIRLDIDPSFEVSVDAGIIRQALLNIILNAIHSMGDAGTLSIGADAGDQSVDLHIRDTGTGIAEEHRDAVFNPFFTTKEKGTGLGLAAALKAVEAHDGEINLASTEGHGAMFTVRLPRAT